MLMAVFPIVQTPDFRAGGNKEGGYVFAFNTIKMTDVEGTEAIVRAYEMGKMLMS